jgi:S1-C subfamily serine protease
VIIVGSQLADQVHAHAGYEASVTFGIVSALGRSGTGTDRIPFEGVIQTDAAGYEGGSGGPLVDVFGSAIGIHYAGHPSAQNINFAIPVTYALDAYAENCETGSSEIRRASIGLRTGTHRVAPTLATRYGERSGAAVLRPPHPGSAADLAGLRVGDVIVRLDGEGISGSAALFRRLDRHLIGKEISVDIVREGEVRTIAMTPAERPH